MKQNIILSESLFNCIDTCVNFLPVQPWPHISQFWPPEREIQCLNFSAIICNNRVKLPIEARQLNPMDREREQEWPHSLGWQKRQKTHASILFVSKQDQTVHRSKVIDSYGEERESKNGHKYSTSEGLKQSIKACLLKNKIKLVIGANLLTQITRQQIFEFWRAEVDKKRYM